MQGNHYLPCSIKAVPTLTCCYQGCVINNFQIIDSAPAVIKPLISFEIWQMYIFKMIVTDKSIDEKEKRIIGLNDLDHNRMIPTSVKLEVWKRDKGQCTHCGSKDNLHFDHILPYSKGGTSLKAENIQLLCARHNLQKHAKIQ